MKKQIYKPKDTNVVKLKQFYMKVVQNESNTKNQSNSSLFKK